MAKKQTEDAEAKPAEAAAPAAADAPKGKKKPKADAAPTAPSAEGAAAPEAAAPAAAAAPGERTAGKKKKPGIPPARGKKLRNLLKQQRSKLSKEPSPLKKAMALLKTLKRAKFDETVEVHMSLGVDTTQSDQLVRGTVPLPHGVGKTVRVVVFCQGENVAKAKEAGADFAGSDDLIEKITKQNWLEFDVALATQEMMGQGQPHRQGPRTSRPDAAAEVRHRRHDGARTSAQAVQVSSRPVRSNTAPTRAATSTPASAR